MGSMNKSQSYITLDPFILSFISERVIMRGWLGQAIRPKERKRVKRPQNRFSHPGVPTARMDVHEGGTDNSDVPLFWAFRLVFRWRAKTREVVRATGSISGWCNYAPDFPSSLAAGEIRAQCSVLRTQCSVLRTQCSGVRTQCSGVRTQREWRMANGGESSPLIEATGAAGEGCESGCNAECWLSVAPLLALH
jgi:hypothetical protein